DPYEEATQQLFEQALHSPEYVPRDHVPVFVPEFERPEDLVPAEDEAPASLLPLGFLSPRIRPLSPRALEAEMNAIASSLYHSLHPLGTPPLLPNLYLHHPLAAELGFLRPIHRLGIGHCLLLLDLEDDGRLRVGQPEGQKDCAAMRAEIKVLRSERLAYEQEGIQTREALARSEAYCRALEARVTVLETHACRLEWQRQAADDFTVQHIMHTQDMEAGACDDTLEDTASRRQIMARNRRGQTLPPTNPNNMTPEAVQTMIDQALLRNSGGGDGSHNSHAENPQNMHIARPCYYADFMNQIRTLGPDANTMTWSVLKKKITDKSCPLVEVKKLEIELWNLKVRDNDIPAYTNRF
nr:hypothetical protein [Tanacetum cinerariifolium]